MTRDLFFVKAPLGAEEGAEDPSIKSKCTNREQGTLGGGHSNPSTEQYTHNSQCKNAMSKYKCHSVSDSCNGDNTPNHTSKSSGSAGTLSIKLGKVTKDRWVLNSVKGYKIEFSLKPHQTHKPYPAQLNQTQQELVSQEIKDMISKGAVTELQTYQWAGSSPPCFWCQRKMAARDR